MITVNPSTGAATARHYYHANRLGSVIAMADQAGVRGDRYVYTPYGVETDGDETGNPFRYTGRRYDPESKLYYYRARYYWPEIGRFLETDPIGYADQMNLYAYVGNNPLNATDPTGMCMCEAASMGMRLWNIMSGTETNPSVGRMTIEWATGSGPESRHLDLSNSFTQEFIRSGSVSDFREFAYNKFSSGGSALNGVSDYGFRFDTEFFSTDTTMQEHFVGSWSGSAVLMDGEITFSIQNESSMTSFAYGTVLERVGLPSVPSYDRSDFAPGATITQSIVWTEPFEAAPQELHSHDPNR